MKKENKNKSTKRVLVTIAAIIALLILAYFILQFFNEYFHHIMPGEKIHDGFYLTTGKVFLFV